MTAQDFHRPIGGVYGRAAHFTGGANYFLGLGPLHLSVLPSRKLVELAVGQWWAQLTQAANRPPRYPDEHARTYGPEAASAVHPRRGGGCQVPGLMETGISR